MDIFKSFGSDQPNEYFTINEIRQHLMNTFICKWKNQLQSATGKLRSYKKIRNIFGYDNHLELPFYLRNPQTKLRTINHQLRIETTRYNLLPANRPTLQKKLDLLRCTSISHMEHIQSTICTSYVHYCTYDVHVFLTKYMCTLVHIYCTYYQYFLHMCYTCNLGELYIFHIFVSLRNIF